MCRSKSIDLETFQTPRVWGEEQGSLVRNDDLVFSDPTRVGRGDLAPACLVME